MAKTGLILFTKTLYSMAGLVHKQQEYAGNFHK